jgi:aspartyl-tRNA(Asn)/glutamyl-tRNA(Gln) amidotransferase subunit A
MTTATDLHQLSAAQAAARIARKEFSPVELVEALITRIGALDPRLKAWATVTGDIARAQAKQAEAEILKTGPRSPIHGIPYGLKDIIDTAGVLTEAGSKVYAGRVPDTDSHVNALLSAAGGILLGKTVTTEFADGHPPATVNPWNAEHTPAGSSSGSGVAVASRMVPAALGTQTVGSVLRPAAYNGVVGFKPTFGRISCAGVVPMSWSCDHVGILVRTVEDAALFLGVLAGSDSDDPNSADRPVPDYLAALGQSAAAPRIGFVRTYFLDEAEDETRADVERVAQQLATAGANVAAADPGIDFVKGYLAHRVIQQSEMAVFHEPMYRGHEDDYLPITREYIDAGFGHSATDFVRANRIRHDMRERALAALAHVDVLMMPTASGPSPRDLSRTGDTRYQSPWSFTGLPSITLPTGLSSKGLPMAVQLVGRPFEEESLLAAAQWVERTLGVELSPPVG